MNLGLITARIIEHPLRFFNFNYYMTEIELHFLHSKSDFAYAVALAEGRVGEDIINFYDKGDYILVEGECLVLENTYRNSCILIYMTDIQPAHLIFKE